VFIKVRGRGGSSTRGWFIASFQFTLVNEPEETLAVGYSVLNFSFNLDFNHFCEIITITSRNIRMQHHVLDLSELHGMKMNLIPISNFDSLKKRRSSPIRLLLFLLGLSLLNDRDCGDFINDGNWDD
jgi:hypothetical protein